MSHTFDNYCLTIDSSCIFTIAVTCGHNVKGFVPNSMVFVVGKHKATRYRTCQYRITAQKQSISVIWVSPKISSLSVLTFTLSIRKTPLKRVPKFSYPQPHFFFKIYISFLIPTSFEISRSIVIYITIQAIFLIHQFDNSGHFPTISAATFERDGALCL